MSYRPIIGTNFKLPDEYTGGRLSTLGTYLYRNGSGLSYWKRIVICLLCHPRFGWNRNLETCWKLYSSSPCPIQHCFCPSNTFWYQSKEAFQKAEDYRMNWFIILPHLQKHLTDHKKWSAGWWRSSLHSRWVTVPDECRMLAYRMVSRILANMLYQCLFDIKKESLF